MTDKWPRGHRMHRSTMALPAPTHALRMSECVTGAQHLRGHDREDVGMWRTYRIHLLQNIPVQNRHTVHTCYRIYRYRTDIPHTPVTEYTGTEPTYRIHLLQNISVQNRHTAYTCYRMYRYRTDIPVQNGHTVYNCYRIYRDVIATSYTILIKNYDA
jgi:hypothetical protein